MDNKYCLCNIVVRKMYSFKLYYIIGFRENIRTQILPTSRKAQLITKPEVTYSRTAVRSPTFEMFLRTVAVN